MFGQILKKIVKGTVKRPGNICMAGNYFKINEIFQ